MGPTELVQAAAIARRYFLDGQSKVAIAKELGLSRFKVARMLEASLQEGIVTIDIRLPTELDGELSDRLRRAYGLHHALVVTAPDEPEANLRHHLGQVAADLLSEKLTANDVLGIGWGRTLYAMADLVHHLPPCAVVQMTGSVGSVSNHATELVRRVSEVSGGPAYPIYAPLLVSDAETAEALRAEPPIAEALLRYSRVTVAVVAVGSWDPPNSELRNSVEAGTRAELMRAGVVAEVCSTLLDRDGNPVSSDLGPRTIAVSGERLRAIPEVIAVAGGRSKAAAVRAVLLGGFATSVITNSTVAEYLLDVQADAGAA